MIRGPKTRAEVEGWEYGVGLRTYRPGLCAAEASSPHAKWSPQCLHKPGHGPEGLWCKQHAKMAEEAR